MSIYHRSDRVLFRFSGPDAQKLLNDVLTGVFAADTSNPTWWALLSPQGKIQAEGLAVWTGDGFILDVHESVADAFHKRMKLYKLRADVTIEDLSDSHALGWSADKTDDDLAVPDPRGRGLGWHIIAPNDQVRLWSDDALPWPWARISANLCELGTDYPADSQFPHDVGMDLLGGVDFNKGCYVGQEVVSRMQHRGTARRRPVHVQGKQLAQGQAVTVDGREAGTIGLVIDGQAIGILRLDRLGDGTGAEVEGQRVDLVVPEWASYGFGEPSGDSADN